MTWLFGEEVLQRFEGVQGQLYREISRLIDNVGRVMRCVNLVCLAAAIFVICGHIYLRGSLVGRPAADVFQMVNLTLVRSMYTTPKGRPPPPKE